MSREKHSYNIIKISVIPPAMYPTKKTKAKVRSRGPTVARTRRKSDTFSVLIVTYSKAQVPDCCDNDRNSWSHHTAFLPKAEERHKLWLHDQWRRGSWLKNKKDMDLSTTVRIDVLGSLRTSALDLDSVLSVYSSWATSVGLETLDDAGN